MRGGGGRWGVFRSLGSLTVKPGVQNIDSNGAQENYVLSGQDRSLPLISNDLSEKTLPSVAALFFSPEGVPSPRVQQRLRKPSRLGVWPGLGLGLGLGLGFRLS